MTEEHWYYLHTNGDIIHKRTWPGEDASDFVRRIWPCDLTNRAHAWTIILGALALGANVSRVRELATRWGCDVRDFVEFMTRSTAPSGEIRNGARKFLVEVVGVDPDAFYDWLAATPKGREPDWATAPSAGLAQEIVEVKARG